MGKALSIFVKIDFQSFGPIKIIPVALYLITISKRMVKKVVNVIIILYCVNSVFVAKIDKSW